MLGLPTTYNIDKLQYLEAVRTLFQMSASPKQIPSQFLPPLRRDDFHSKPQLVVGELGGDFIEGCGPEFLASDHCMRNVRAIVLCSDSPTAAYGALSLMDELLTCRPAPPIFLNVPLCTPQSFYRRVRELLPFPRIAGVVDAQKPRGAQRLDVYAADHGAVFSPEAMIAWLRKPSVKPCCDLLSDLPA